MKTIKQWDELPTYMRNDVVYPYYVILSKHRMGMAMKRLFDFIISLLMLIVLSPLFVVLIILIKVDSKGPAFFRQTRVTQYGKRFRIYKFRTMVVNAESVGTQVTVENDARITRIGRMIRKCRLDEIPQLLNVLLGDMSFVGTRPEVPKYVNCYTEEMYATLLLPAGITSKASIKFKDEDTMLEEAKNVDDTYVEKILPLKMKYNLEEIREFSIWNQLKTMFQTVKAVL